MFPFHHCHFFVRHRFRERIDIKYVVSQALRRRNEAIEGGISGGDFIRFPPLQIVDDLVPLRSHSIVSRWRRGSSRRLRRRRLQ